MVGITVVVYSVILRLICSLKVMLLKNYMIALWVIFVRHTHLIPVGDDTVSEMLHLPLHTLAKAFTSDDCCFSESKCLHGLYIVTLQN